MDQLVHSAIVGGAMGFGVSESGGRSGVTMAELGRPRTLDEARAWMHERSRAQVHPMGLISHSDAAPVIDSLRGLDGASWAAAWGAAGHHARVEGDAAAARGDFDHAKAAYLKAHGFFFLGRFPCPNHPDKLACHIAERETVSSRRPLFRFTRATDCDPVPGQTR